MKKFLALLYLVAITFILGVQQVSAQSALLNAPSDVCKGSFATMNAHLTGGTAAITNPTFVWTITKTSKGGTTTSLYGTFNGQTAAQSNTDNSTVSVQFNTVDSFYFTVKIPWKNGKKTDTITLNKLIVVHDCSIATCYIPPGGQKDTTGFKEDFGKITDGQRHQVQAPATINYIFQSGANKGVNVEDNYYCVATSTYQHDGWVDKNDHTSNDGVGAMLVCNSQNQGLAFYNRTITGLCPGAKYSFNAFFMNLNTQAILESTCAGGYMYAGVDFQILDASTNALLATFPTYDVSMGIPASTWNNYGGTFKTPAGVTNIIFRMVNRNPGGCGNDIAVDDITFSYCAPVMRTYIDGLPNNTKNSICQNQSVNLTGTVSPGDYFSKPTYFWQDSIAGQPGWNDITIDGTQFIKTNDSTLTVSGDVLQSNGNNPLVYYFRMKVVEQGQSATGSCARYTDPDTLTVLPVPMITLDNPRICIGDSVHLTTQKVYSHYKWVINSTPVRYIEGDTVAGVYNAIADKPLVSTTYNVIGTVSYGKGKTCSRTATSNVVVDTLPKGNLLPVVSNICVNTQITLKANPSNAAFPIRWSTGLPDTLSSLVVGPKTAPGAYTYTDTLYNGMCKITQTATVNVRPMPTPSVSQDTLKNCANGSFTLNGSTPAAGQMGTWSLLAPTNGATIAAADIHNPSAAVTGLTLGSKVTAVWDMQDTTSLTTCDTSAKVVLWNRPMPTTGAIAQTTLTNCAGTYSLTANNPAAGEIGTWSIVSNTSGGSVGVNIASPNSPSTTVTLTGAKPQTVVLAWTLNNGTCDGTSAKVTLNYVAPPTISIDSVAASCANNGTFNLVINGFTGNPTRISLTGTIPGFSAWTGTPVDFTQPLKITLPVTYPNTTAAGTYKFTLTPLNDSTACTGTPITFNIVVKAPSTAPTSASASPSSICVTGSTKLTVTGGVLGTGAQWVWYAGGCGSGTAVGSGNNLTVNGVNSTTVYYVRAEDLTATCASTACANVKVTVYQAATPANAGPGQEHCNDANFKMAADSVTVGTGTWSVTSGTASIAQPNSPTSWVTVPAGTSATLLWTVSNGVCSGGTSSVILTNRASIANDVISANQKICLGGSASPIVSVGTISGGSGTYTYQWQSAPKANGPYTNIGGATAAAYNPGALTVDSIFFRRVVNSGACADTSNTIRIIVVNKDPYVVSKSADSTIQCSKTLTYTNYFTQPVFADPYGTPLNITFADVTTGSCPQTITRTWTATDSCTRKVTASQTLTIKDITPPVFDNKPANVTVECSAIPATPTVTATDECSSATVTLVTTSTQGAAGTCAASNYVITNTWTAADVCGNKAVYVQTITVQDKTAPKFVTGAPADITIGCDSIPTQANLAVTDNCTPAGSITVNKFSRVDSIPGACKRNYILTYVWVATDLCGNTDSVKQKITVRDMTAPKFTTPTPADITVSCSAIPAQADLTASDNCAPAASIKITKTTSTKAIPGACSKNYILTYTWTATDECGNSASVSQRLTVVDTTAPNFTTSVPAAVTVDCNKIPAQIDLSVSDNCSPSDSVTVAKSQTITNGSCANNYTITYKWVATDLCGNTKTATQVVTVQDTTRPAFNVTIPKDTTVGCDSIPTLVKLTATDNCSATGNIILDATRTAVPIPGACANNYKLIDTYTAKDECSNIVTATRTITVVDRTGPVFNGPLPGNITVSCSNIPPQDVLTATDKCTTDPTKISITSSRTRIDTLGCANNYHLVDTWVAKDECNNTTTWTRTITVKDTTAPAFTSAIPKDTVVNCDAIPAQPTLTVSDNCSPTDSIKIVKSYTDTKVGTGCAKNFVRVYTWTATDQCNNKTTAQWKVTVQDTTRPYFTTPIPAAITVNCNAVPKPDTLKAMDNCTSGFVKVTISTSSSVAGTCPVKYSFDYIWTAVDSCGNTAIAKQHVTVQDTTRPVFASGIPTAITVNCDSALTQPDIAVTDNCSTGSGITITKTKSPITAGTCPVKYTFTYTWTAKDECSNTAIFTQLVTVQDTTKPKFTTKTPNDTTVNCDAVPPQATLFGSDNCSMGSNLVIKAFAADTVLGSCGNNYSFNYVWTATDECQNVTTVKQHITVQDTTRPKFIIVPADVTVECNAIPVMGNVTVADNCGGSVTIKKDSVDIHLPGACGNSFVRKFTWTAEDQCHNKSTATQTVTVQDKTGPVFTGPLPKDTITTCDTIPAQPVLSATDNCSAPTKITITPTRTVTKGACANSYTITDSWKAVDECLNATTWTRTITVVDNKAPKFTTAVPKDTVVNCDAVPAQPTLSVSDNCSPTDSIKVVKTATKTVLSAGCAKSYKLTYTWTATDQCGNKTVANWNITVQDTTRPYFTMPTPANRTVNCDNVPKPDTLKAMDNCTAGFVKVTISQTSPVTGTCPVKYSFDYVWTAVDSCGNTAVTKQHIIVQDTTRPAFSVTVPNDTTVSCDAIPALVKLLATDNCTAAANIVLGSTRQYVPIPGACANNYQLVDTYTAKDDCSNILTATRTITVVDKTAPKFTGTLPKDSTVSCDSVPAQPTLNVSDNCSPTDSITITATRTRVALATGACANSYKLVETWTAKDQCSNVGTYTRTITVLDKKPPVFNGTAPKDTTISCDSLFSQPVLTAKDNCSDTSKVKVVATRTTVKIPGACANNYQVVENWTATDECGNTALLQRTITVIDKTAPKFTTFPPKDTTVNCDSVPKQMDLQVLDNCSPTDSVKVVKTSTTKSLSATCAKNYLLTYTWTATDQCGNKAVVNWNITVQDTTRPKFITPVPKDTTVNCDSIPAQMDLKVQDNCSTGATDVTITKTVKRTDLVGACTNRYVLTYTWTAKDLCGNTATVQQVINVQDTTRPKFTTPAPKDTTVNCDSLPVQADLQVADNCSPAANIKVVKGVTRVNIPGACANKYQLVYTWTATDECNNKTIVSQTVTVQDTTRPAFVTKVPKDTLVNCDSIPAQIDLQAKDNCSSAANVTVTKSVTTVAIPGTTCAAKNYRLIYTWTAKDECGNTNIATQTVTVQDTTRPKFTMPIPKDTMVSCESVPTQMDLTVSDNCTPAANITVNKSVVRTNDPGACVNSFKLTYTWIATDECGNKATAVQVVTVKDTSAPKFAMPIPLDTTVNCDAIPAQQNLNVSDNCSPLTKITVVKNASVTAIPGACANNYQILYTWTATDECGNKATVKQVITVMDNTKPAFVAKAPNDTTVNCDAVPAQPDIKASDNCSPADSIKITKHEIRQNGSCNNSYVLIRTWTATDQCGNATTLAQTITVQDTTKPRFLPAVPADVTVNCDAVPTQVTLTASDNCTAAGTLKVVKTSQRIDNPGACANNYKLLYTWTVTDECGNTATATQTITVVDNTKPTFTKPAPADVTVQCDAVPAQIDLTYADNCSAVNKISYTKQVVRTNTPGGCVNNYTLRYTWIIKDECGNTDSTHQTITVIDTKPPVFTVTAPQDITVSCDKVPAQPTLYAKDACDPNPITAVADERREDIPGACANNYRLIRTWTAYDACGNKATLTQIVTVVDNTKPTFPSGKPADATVECNAIPVQQPIPVADNCSATDKVTLTMYSWKELIKGACANNYKLHYTWVAKDECGNVDSVSQILTVQNTQKPTFDQPLPRDTTVNCDATLPWPTITATSACGALGNVKVVTSSTTKSSSTCKKAYTETRTWTATDECGNTAIWKQVINVQDTTRPVFTMKIPRDTTVSCDAIPAAPQLSGSDNCSTGTDLSGSYKVKTIAGSCPQSYQLIRTWTLKDGCGNTNTAVQTITVRDMTAPVIAAAPADITIYCQDPVPAHVNLKATDNCDPTFPKNATYSEDPYVKDICNGYTITRRWSAVDACGNVAQQVIQRVIIKPCSKPALVDSLPITCSSNPYITLGTKGTVNRPTYTLTAVQPTGVVNVPVSQTYNVFNLKGATSATFIVTDGLTGCVSDPKTYTLQYNTSPVVNLGRDTSICGGNSLVLDAGAANFNYNIVWSTGEKTQRINITKAGTYWVTVTNANCVVTDTIKVGLIPTPLVDIPDTTICRGQTVKLDAYVNGAAYLWSNGTTTSSIITGVQDQYWVKVSKNGCITIDTVNVTVNPPPDIQLKQDTAICPGQSVMLTVSADGGRIRWVNGSTQPSIVVTKPGGYWVTVTKNNCVVRDTVNVREQPKLKLDLGPDQSLCPGSQITLDATNADAISYLWNDGDPDPVKTVTSAGLYKVAVMDRFCQMVYFDSVKVSMSGIPTVSLGNDTIMCNGETLTLTPKGTGIRSVLWSDGSAGSTLNVSKPGTYSVTAFNECGSSTDQVTVTFRDCVPNPTFPNAFSPNGDGKNDIFLPTVRGPMYNYELRIFNRWGQLIFLSTDAKKGWDGTYNGQPVEVGTYVYWVTYKASPTGPANVIKGSVVLIR